MENVIRDTHYRGRNGKRIAGKIIGGIFMAALFAFIFGLFVMLLWNWLMPALFNLPVISYWQAVGVIIIARLIFGGGHHRPSFSSREPLQHKFNKYKLMRYCGHNGEEWKHYEDFWKEEGSEAFKKYVEKKKGNEDKKEEQ
jgi:hypothetical protein